MTKKRQEFLCSLLMLSSVIWLSGSVYASQDSPELVVFEDDFDNTMKSEANWETLWTRQEGRAEMIFSNNGRSNTRSLFIENRGDKDWTVDAKQLILVNPGEVYDYEGFAMAKGHNAITLIGIILYDRDQNIMKIQYADESINKADQWYRMTRSFEVPPGGAFIRMRILGVGKGRFYFDDIRLARQKEAPSQDIKASGYFLENPMLRFDYDPAQLTINVKDKRIGKEWSFNGVLEGKTIKGIVKKGDRQMEILIVDSEGKREYLLTITLAEKTPEINYEIEQRFGDDFQDLDFPPFVTWTEGVQLVVPLQQGMLLPHNFPPQDFPLRLRYNGEWPMAFLGVVDKDQGWMEFVETPIDFEIIRDTSNTEELRLKNIWLGEKGSFSYKRRLWHIFFDRGGYVAMAKWYRQFAARRGLLTTLPEKNVTRHDNISKLIGAVDIWYEDSNKVEFAQDLIRLGIKKALISNLAERSDIYKLNVLGFATAVSVNFQDALIPEGKPQDKVALDRKNDFMIGKQGDWLRWGQVKNGDNSSPGGVICSLRGYIIGQKEIEKIVKEKGPLGTCLDSTTASPAWECYHPQHPLTRSDDIKYRMLLLNFVANTQGLLTGCEDGVDCAVPYCDYLEGMMSIRLGRISAVAPDKAHGNPQTVSAEFLNYNVGEKLRIPLWQLIYGDAVISTWHSDDSSNLVSAAWYRRDLLNILYGTMPFWAIPDWSYWKQNKGQFQKSYQNVSPIFEKVCTLEMLDHRFLSADRSVQETTYSGDIKIIVNFGEQEFQVPEPPCIIAAHGFIVFEKGAVWKQGACP
jgi:hypothetical protein